MLIPFFCVLFFACIGFYPSCERLILIFVSLLSLLYVFVQRHCQDVKYKVAKWLIDWSRFVMKGARGGQVLILSPRGEGYGIPDDFKNFRRWGQVLADCMFELGDGSEQRVQEALTPMSRLIFV